METNLTYYVALLALIIIGVLLIKKVASCLLKTLIILVLAALGSAIYWLYFS